VCGLFVPYSLIIFEQTGPIFISESTPRSFFFLLLILFVRSLKANRAVMRTSEVSPDVQCSVVLEFLLSFRKLFPTFVGKWQIANVISTVRKLSGFLIL
jgi:hypothetical protein